MKSKIELLKCGTSDNGSISGQLSSTANSSAVTSESFTATPDSAVIPLLSSIDENSNNEMKVFENIIYDAILIDYEMPKMNGPEAIQAIRKLGFNGKIIGLTGNSKASLVDNMYHAGADEVFIKPINSAILRNILRNILNK